MYPYNKIALSIHTIGLDPVKEITDPDVNVEAAAFINALPSSWNQIKFSNKYGPKT